jgi:death-on-curing protein
VSELAFLTLVEVLEIHQDQIVRYGGRDGIRDLGLLESALAMPQAGFSGKRFHSTLFEMAAAYAFHVAQNQAFVDGNKRTALASALIFLEINDVTVDDAHGKLYDAMIGLGTKKISKVGLAELFETLSTPNRRI